MAQETPAERIVAEAAQLIEEIERQLDDGDSFLKEHRIDRNSLASGLGPKEKDEAARLVAADLAAVDREVEEARMRQSFDQAGGGRSHSAMRRTMI